MVTNDVANVPCLTEVNVVMSKSDRYFLLSNSHSIDDRVRKATKFTSNNIKKNLRAWWKMLKTICGRLSNDYLFRENSLERKNDIILFLYDLLNKLNLKWRKIV